MHYIINHLTGGDGGFIYDLYSGLFPFLMALAALGIYQASKWALEAMSDTYRIELAQFGIDVVVLELGPFRSSFQDEHGTGSDGARELQYPQFTGGVQRSENAHRQGWGRFADTGVLVKAVDELIAQPAGTRPWRVALHPLRELLDPYNAHLEELERTVLTSRGDTAFLPPGG